MSDATDNDTRPPWSRRSQEIGAIVWSSFLAACVATMVFFALFDPVLLGNDDQPPSWLANRMTGYAAGFFFFWIVTMTSALLTAFLLDTLPHNQPRNDTGGTSSRREP